jgi:hypothetical protein
MTRAGQNRIYIYAPYINVTLVTFLPKMLYMLHHLCMVLASPRNITLGVMRMVRV